MKELKYSFAQITAREYKNLKQPNEHLYKKIMFSKNLNTDRILETLQNAGVSFITINDPEYPLLLKETYDPPYIIYYKGDISLLKKTSFAIVGSRKATTYTKAALNYIIPHLKDYVIISGLAYGADEIAHKISIANNIPTIGVLGFGHNTHYPKTTEQTRSIIEQNYLTISEFPPDSEIERWKFVSRNRIIAGISEGTLVTEAEIKSGSLITLEIAMDENRHAFCLPGNMTSSLSIGTNLRIQEGCIPVVFPEDITTILNESKIN
ncbi:DNA-processing protein DprA [Phocicoccus pinnipedialis]|uniref:DNA processing protein DprA n=1 Tax=Phocicoccus pinnipedialis TaxID=110845 RepID=A0A6V7RG41_9BACL|nr:DNA-processing protein DprA [Jeotgalicoccus pinnipedialis]MBP1939103.1 DNA processing protein [Jeotgalicoccus pinnipedialis]CAD2076800.1 DNA processing protein DprA [Jeotgalicoccus pinnipedialis]